MTALALRTSHARKPLPGFRYETELAAPVEHHLTGRPGTWTVAHELETPAGAPDLVAARHTYSTARRLRSGPPPLCSLLEVRLVSFLSEVGAVEEAELRAWAPWGWRDLRVRALDPLARRGIVERFDEHWRALAVSQPFAELVAVELKLRDWRKGLVQARHNRAFVHESWLAVGRRTLPGEASSLASVLGVGVMLIQPGGEVVELVQPNRGAPIAKLEARLAAELLLAQALEKRRPGVEEARPLAGSPRGRKRAVGC